MDGSRKPGWVGMGMAVIVWLLAAAWGGCSRDGTAQGPIRVSGTIEATDAELSFKVAGRVRECLVSEGDAVMAGQPVATLDDVELLHELAIRRAEEKSAEARLSELEAGPRMEEMDAAEAAVLREKAERDRQQAEDGRYTALAKIGATTEQAVETVRASLAVAEARLAEAEARRDLLAAGARTEVRAQAAAHLDQARAAAALAQARADGALLVAPFDGIVLSRSLEPGEFAGPGSTVLTLGHLRRVWLKAYVSETDLGRVKVGQRAVVTTDSTPGEGVEGRLTFIAPQAEFTPRHIQTEQERVKLVYRVKIEVPNESLALKPGMPADAMIEVK